MGRKMLRWYSRVALVAILVALATVAASVEVTELVVDRLGDLGFKW
jgi:hypothetical protein